MWTRLIAICAFALPIHAAMFPRGLAGSSALGRRGGSPSAHTCLKDQGSGFVCDSETSIDSCNTAVNDACNQAATLAVSSDANNCVSGTFNDCYAAFCLGKSATISYGDCVAGFQDIMADCIDSNGAGFDKTKQGGSRNIHFDDTSAGSSVDDSQPEWTIGAQKCFGGGAATFYPQYMPGTADIP